MLAPPLELSGRETPVSVDSIPLEWDHTVDVGGSSHEDDEEATFFSALSGRTVPLVSWGRGVEEEVGEGRRCSGSSTCSRPLSSRCEGHSEFRFAASSYDQSGDRSLG